MSNSPKSLPNMNELEANVLYMAQQAWIIDRKIARYTTDDSIKSSPSVAKELTALVERRALFKVALRSQLHILKLNNRLENVQSRHRVIGAMVRKDSAKPGYFKGWKNTFDKMDSSISYIQNKVSNLQSLKIALQDKSRSWQKSILGQTCDQGAQKIYTKRFVRPQTSNVQRPYTRRTSAQPVKLEPKKWVNTLKERGFGRNTPSLHSKG